MITLKFNNKKDKKKFNIKVIATSLVAITLIGIVGISIGRFSGANPLGSGVVLDGFTSIQSNLSKGFNFITSNFNEIINYNLDNVQSLESLKKSLNFIDESYRAKSITASVVSKNDGNWYSSFVIGAGSKQGVKKDSIVMNGSGLVGMVYEVSENYSKAISLLDTKSSVSFKLLKDDKYKGVITQNSTLDDKENYKNKGQLFGYMFDSSYKVLPGDVIMTSGLGIYPKDIPIGEIEKL